MTAAVPAQNRTLRPGTDFSITVPGTWVDFPLDDDAALRRTVSAVVKRRVGTDDRLALMRAEARNQLMDAAARAKAAGAIAFAMSLELVPGVPFPASMMVERRAWLTPEQAGDTAALRLARDFPQAQLIDGVGPRVFARHRRYERRTFGEETTLRSELEYQVPHPERGLLRCVFSVEMIDESDVFVELFDVIVGTVRFPEASGSAS